MTSYMLTRKGCPMVATKIDQNGWCTYPKVVPLVLTRSQMASHGFKVGILSPSKRRCPLNRGSGPTLDPVALHLKHGSVRGWLGFRVGGGGGVRVWGFGFF